MTRLATALTVAWICGAAAQLRYEPRGALDGDDLVIIRLVVESTIVPEIRAAKPGPKPIALLIDQTVKLCDPAERRLQAWRCMSAELETRGLPRQRTTETSFQVPEFSLPSVRLVAPEVVQRAFESGPQAKPADGWQQLGRSFPGFRGVAQVSAPAYVDDGAVVYASFSCGSLCGKTWLVRLAHKDGQWRVVDRRLLAVS